MHCKSATTVTSKNTVNFRNSISFWRIPANIESQCSMNVLIANLLSRIHLNSWHSDKQWSQKVNCFFSLGSTAKNNSSIWSLLTSACRQTLQECYFRHDIQLQRKTNEESHSYHVFKNQIGFSSYNCTHHRQQVVKYVFM